VTTAKAVEARTVERDIARQPLIDGDRAAIAFLACVVPGDVERIELVADTVGAADIRRVEGRPVEILARDIEVLLAERLAVRADAGGTRIPVLADTDR